MLGFYAQVEQHLAALFVRPDAQGQGIGAQLLAHAVSRSQTLTLAVYVRNASSVRFYQQRGFRVSAEQVDESTGERELLMRYSG